ncbi:MAG: hypothetical protein ACRERD_17330, partial [Candidatus Binatia bacterium]
MAIADLGLNNSFIPQSTLRNLQSKGPLSLTLSREGREDKRSTPMATKKHFAVFDADSHIVEPREV